jgi:hypothetical protein
MDVMCAMRRPAGSLWPASGALALLALLGCSPSWTPLEPSDAGFAVEMPGEPEQQTRTVKTVAGEVAMRIYSAEQGRYMVSFTDYPEEIVSRSTSKAVLDGARDGAAVNIGGEVLSERAFDFDGQPARDVVFLDPTRQVELRMRLILAGARLYQLASVGPRGDADDEVAARFRDSFRLLGAAAPTP